MLEALAAQLRERLDEPQEVLLRAQVADGEQVGAVRARRQRRVADRQRGRVGDDPHARLVDVVAAHDVARRVARDADDPLRRARGARRERAVLPAGAAAEVLGEDLEREVVDRHDAHARPRERQEAVRRVDEVGAHPAQAHRQADLLVERLGPRPAAGEEAEVEAVVLGQRRDELLRVAAPAAQLRRERVAGVDGDDRHGRNHVTPRARLAATAGRRAADPVARVGCRTAGASTRDRAATRSERGDRVDRPRRVEVTSWRPGLTTVASLASVKAGAGAPPASPLAEAGPLAGIDDDRADAGDALADGGRSVVGAAAGVGEREPGRLARAPPTGRRTRSTARRSVGAGAGHRVDDAGRPSRRRQADARGVLGDEDDLAGARRRAAQRDAGRRDLRARHALRVSAARTRRVLALALLRAPWRVAAVERTPIDSVATSGTRARCRRRRWRASPARRRRAPRTGRAPRRARRRRR